MIRKFSILCPISFVLIVTLLFAVFAVNINAFTLDETEYDSEISAENATMDNREFSYLSDEVSPQAHRDSGYELTDIERTQVECIVMCEAGGEGEKGQMMVAQCILDGLLRNGYTLDEYIKNYQVMSTSYGNVTEDVKNSVSRVFDNGERVTESKADLWYNPALTASAWHEAQEYIITIGSHRFFWMVDDTF